MTLFPSKADLDVEHCARNLAQADGDVLHATPHPCHLYCPIFSPNPVYLQTHQVHICPFNSKHTYLRPLVQTGVGVGEFMASNIRLQIFSTNPPDPKSNTQTKSAKCPISKITKGQQCGWERTEKPGSPPEPHLALGPWEENLILGLPKVKPPGSFMNPDFSHEPHSSPCAAFIQIHTHTHSDIHTETNRHRCADTPLTHRHTYTTTTHEITQTHKDRLGHTDTHSPLPKPCRMGGSQTGKYSLPRTQGHIQSLATEGPEQAADSSPRPLALHTACQLSTPLFPWLSHGGS